MSFKSAVARSISKRDKRINELEEALGFLADAIDEKGRNMPDTGTRIDLALVVARAVLAKEKANG